MNLLKDLEVIEVSLVDKPAIKRTFLMTKRAPDNKDSDGSSDDKADKGLLNKIRNAIVGGPREELNTVVKGEIIALKADLDMVVGKFSTLVKLIAKKTDKGDDMEPDEIKALIEKTVTEAIGDAVKSAVGTALEIPEEKKVEIKKAADEKKDADEKLVKSLKDIDTSLKGIDTKFDGMEKRLSAVEESKPDKKSLDADADKKKVDKKAEESDSFSGILFR